MNSEYTCSKWGVLLLSAGFLSLIMSFFPLLLNIDRSEPVTILSHIAPVLITAAILIFFWQTSLERSKKREQQLAETDARLSNLVDQTLAGIYIIEDMSVRFANAEFARIFGYETPDQIVDRISINTLIAPSDLSMVSELIRQRQCGAINAVHFTFKGIKRDGSLLDLEVHGRSFQFQDRPAVIGVVLDITEKKRAEEKLRQSSLVFANSHEAIAITDAEGTIIAINPAFSVITEYSEAEAIGQNMRILKSNNHDSRFYAGIWSTLSSTGSWQGEIWDRRKNGEVFPTWLSINAVRDENGDVEQYVSVLTDISRMSHSETKLERLARHDMLTGLPNRIFLADRLKHGIDRCRRNGTKLAILFIDLDRFKIVNDTLGHAAGDALLKMVATRLHNRLRTVDTLARIGGDEFIILLEELNDRNSARTVAEDLINQLELPFQLPTGAWVEIGASIGIASYPEDGDLPDILIEHADAALYNVKRSTRGTYQLFDNELD